MQKPSQPPSSGGSSPFLLGGSDWITIHGNLCDEYGRVEQSRQGMLQYVISVTSLLGSASVFTGAITKNIQLEHFLIVIGCLGMFSTFALYFREVRLNKEADRLIMHGQLYEKFLQVPPTMFFRDNKSGLSTLLIYAGAFTTWFCVATWFAFPPGFALLLALPIFLVTYAVEWFIRHKFLLVEVRVGRP